MKDKQDIGAERRGKIIKQAELTEHDLDVVRTVRPLAKDELRKRFKMLESNPLGVAAKCCFFKSIVTQDDFADYAFYWGRLAFGVLLNVVMDGRSLLPEERRLEFLKYCEKFRLFPLLFRIEVETGKSDGQDPDAAEFSYKVGGMQGWGFMDFRLGVETDGDFMLAMTQPDETPEMSDWEVQAIACSDVRKKFAAQGLEILSACDWPGAIPSFAFKDPQGQIQWVVVEGVREFRDEMPDIKGMLSMPELAHLRALPGYYVQVKVSGGRNATGIFTDWHGGVREATPSGR